MSRVVVSFYLFLFSALVRVDRKGSVAAASYLALSLEGPPQKKGK